MKKIIMVLAFIAVSASAQDAFGWAYDGKEAIKQSARNPDSVVFEGVFESHTGAICYKYRWQNGFGGMVGDLAVLVPSSQTFMTTQSKGFEKVFKKNCTSVKQKFNF